MSYPPKSWSQRSATALLMIAFLGLMGLAAVVRPSSDDSALRQEAGRSTAQTSCNQIAEAISRFVADVEHLPVGFRGRSSYGWLHGPGVSPQFQSRPDGLPGQLRWFLQENFMAGDVWAGPYMHKLIPDPWGRQYIVRAESLWQRSEANTESYVWILSAGVNGIVETQADDQQLCGDDIGVYLPL